MSWKQPSGSGFGERSTRWALDENCYSSMVSKQVRAIHLPGTSPSCRIQRTTTKFPDGSRWAESSPHTDFWEKTLGHELSQIFSRSPHFLEKLLPIKRTDSLKIFLLVKPEKLPFHAELRRTRSLSATLVSILCGFA